MTPYARCIAVKKHVIQVGRHVIQIGDVCHTYWWRMHLSQDSHGYSQSAHLFAKINGL